MGCTAFQVRCFLRGLTAGADAPNSSKVCTLGSPCGRAGVTDGAAAGEPLCSAAAANTDVLVTASMGGVNAASVSSTTAGSSETSESPGIVTGTISAVPSGIVGNLRSFHFSTTASSSASPCSLETVSSVTSSSPEGAHCGVKKVLLALAAANPAANPALILPGLRVWAEPPGRRGQRLPS